MNQAGQAKLTYMLPDFPIKTMSDLELVFITLATRASVLSVKLPILRGSLENWCKYIFRNFGTYHGNPFDVLDEHLRKRMEFLLEDRGVEGDERFRANHHILAIRTVLNDIIYYKGTWYLLNE